MPNPFDLADETTYRAWRDSRLERYSARPSDPAVGISRLSEPTPRERAALMERIKAYNLAIVRVEPAQVTPEAVLAFGLSLGLARADINRFADASAISRITQADPSQDRHAPNGPRGDYIPYTNKPLSWHTDGYYNPPERQIQAWTLFCVRPAVSGGINSLLDHEILYIRLRDTSPDLIAALAHPEALSIPAHIENGVVVRATSTGPVFSIRQGRLHMRYTARTRNARWRDTPETDAARRALDRLFSTPDVFTFSHGLESGEGLVSNNVPHNRSGFIDSEDDRLERLLIRVRYHDWIRDDEPR
ncbi:TauD/TfdA family dioxygenase [Thiocystis violacea]|uniref:TauD/TfdA family dioxygenase n=1 Tax=Thiocystis violacea TaxID=13725 RepID=UPI001905DD9D|nr:TauD/TfdA family dioxygenase [Thiocystis violacea]MBK1716854.1 taurine catabolism dioxygenase TauD [Thiocystis violacea]